MLYVESTKSFKSRSEKKLHLLFLEFKNHLATCSWSCFVNKTFKISFHFPHKASHWTQEYEYHFSTHFIPLFESLAVQI